MTRATSLTEILPEFIERAHRMVWCSASTVDHEGRPRSRIMHPYWEGQIGWIATAPHTLTKKHLAYRPYISLAYIADIHFPVYADCAAEWADDPEDRLRVWDFFANAPEPLGYDPTPFFGTPESREYGVLKVTAYRITLAELGNPERIVWRGRT